MKTWTHWLAALGAATVLAACGGDDDPPPTAAPGTLTQEASARGFTALVAAADKAGLAGALSSASSSLTVFAPTDAAFAALASRLGFASATAMVNALDGPTLAKILQYHVLPTRQQASHLAAGAATQNTLYEFEGAAATLALSTTGAVRITDEVLNQATVTGADVAALPKPAAVATVQGGTFTVDAALTITDGRSRTTNLVATDIVASNGVVHVIDNVLLPAP